MLVVLRKVYLVNLVSLVPVMSNTLFEHLCGWPRLSNFLFKEHSLICSQERDLCFSRVVVDGVTWGNSKTRQIKNEKKKFQNKKIQMCCTEI